MNRRHFFGKAAAFAGVSSALVSSSFLTSCSSNKTAGHGEKPNIIIIVLDDAGWGDVGYHGSKIKTPNIDRMTREGIELDNFYVNPTCSPTRAALLTGKPASRSGILSPINYNQTHSLPAGTATIAEMLAHQGYDTAISGKWHLGWGPEAVPNNYGFKSSYGFLHGWLDQYTHLTREEIPTWHRNGTFIEEDGHATDLIVDNAIDYVINSRDKTKPFFLYLPFSVPHLPLQEESSRVDPYKGVLETESERFYAASMTHVDEAIGKLMSVIDREDLGEDTLIIFFSDNGATAPGKKNYLQPPPTIHTTSDVTKFGNNLPLRGWKGGLYEGGIRVPAFISWPGKLNTSKVSETISVYDIFPTLAYLSGADIAEYSGVEGINVWPALSGEALPENRSIYWRTPQGMAIRKGNWKLIHQGRTPETDTDELFNISEDPYEEHDLANENPKILAELKTELKRQFSLD
ncbi:sulfatase-like hydrolase/transferase [Candidatus Latescibacterota bacterium]